MKHVLPRLLKPRPILLARGHARIDSRPSLGWRLCEALGQSDLGLETLPLTLPLPLLLLLLLPDCTDAAADLEAAEALIGVYFSRAGACAARVLAAGLKTIERGSTLPPEASSPSMLLLASLFLGCGEPEFNLVIPPFIFGTALRETSGRSSELGSSPAEARPATQARSRQPTPHRSTIWDHTMSSAPLEPRQQRFRIYWPAGLRLTSVLI
jgi:hypothetical protein